MRSSALALTLLLAAKTFAATGPLEDPHKTVVAILMFDGVQVIDYAAPYEVFSQADFTIYTVSKEGHAVKASQGLKSEVDHSFASAPAAQIVVVPGGHVDEVQNDPATLEWLRKQASGAEHVMSVCTGSFILARSGLLDGKKATTFHNAFDAMEHEFPKVSMVRDQRWVDNGKLVTSSGLASGIDTSLHVVAEVRGMKAARSVAMTLEYDWKPEAGFVRGTFPDRHVRMPSTLRPPEGFRFETITSIGDMRSWESEYLVHSPLGPAALFDEFEKQARQDASMVVKRPDAHQLAWEYESRFGGRWNLSLVVNAADPPDRYRVTSTLTPVR